MSTIESIHKHMNPLRIEVGRVGGGEDYVVKVDYRKKEWVVERRFG